MVNKEVQNKIEEFLNSRKDWSNPKFKELVLYKFKLNDQDFQLQEIKLRGKIEDLYNAFINPVKYDEDGKIKNSKTHTNTIPEKQLSIGFLEDPIVNITECKKTKPVVLSIDNYLELIPAIKCILWSLDNEPKTKKDLLSNVMIRTENNVYLPLLDTITEEDYTEVNNAFNMAISTDLLHFQKFKKSYKWVYLYYNPTDKRQGYFYKGELYKLKDLSEINNVKMGTIQRRFQKMKIENAIK
jgi:hypothetical protein